MRLFLRKLKTASRFSPGDWKTIATAYFLLLKVRFLLVFRAPRLMEKALTSAPAGIASLTSFARNDERKHLLSLFHLAWRYQIGRPNCLPTSLAKQAFLVRYGFPVDLRIGVHKQDTDFKAHAWCEDSAATKSPQDNPPSSFKSLEPIAVDSIESSQA